MSSRNDKIAQQGRIIVDRDTNSLRVSSILKIPRINDLATVGNNSNQIGNILFDRNTKLLYYHNGNEWVTTGGNTGDCITEATPDAGVAIEKPLFVNRHGIGRVNLDDDVNNTGSTVLTGDDFNLNFESNSIVGPGGPRLLLQLDDTVSPSIRHIFTAPPIDNYSNSCLDYTTMYVQFSCTFNAFTSGAVPTYATFLVNNVEYGQPVQFPFNSDSDEHASSVVLTDILPLSPGDVVDILIDPIDQDVTIIDKGTFITTTVVGFEVPSS